MGGRQQLQSDVRQLKSFQSNVVNSTALACLREQDGEVTVKLAFPWKGSSGTAERVRLEVALQISETHLYPASHTGFCFVQDVQGGSSTTQSTVTDIVGEVGLEAVRLHAFLQKLFLALGLNEDEILIPIVAELLTKKEKQAGSDSGEDMDMDELVVEEGSEDSTDEDDEETGVEFDEFYETAVQGSFTSLDQRSQSQLGVIEEESELLSTLGVQSGTWSKGVWISFSPATIGLSEEACVAWSFPYDDYILIVVDCGASGYKSMSDTQQWKDVAQTFSFKVVSSPQPTMLSGSQGSDFILSWTLGDLLNKQFVRMLSRRLADSDVTWKNLEAEAFGRASDKFRDEQLYVNWRAAWDARVPRQKRRLEQSFLFSTLDFVGRHILFANQFCMICHDVVGFEGIKPYVCGSPLCTFQYTDLGLGPNVEAEILHNGTVVNLLVVLLAESCRTSEVLDPYPEVGLYFDDWLEGPGRVYMTNRMEKGVLMNVQVENDEFSVLRFFRVGDLFEVTDVPDHSRKILEVYAKESSILVEGNFLDDVKGMGYRIRQNLTCRFKESAENVGKVLRILPSIEDMQKSINTGKSLPATLGDINPLCFPLLRWIISSNRTHLRQLKGDEQIPSLPGYLQFAMVSGAPEKEIRFAKAKETEKVGSLFAWHGSPIGNWHSIIRRGLNYHKTTHGRAYGNGVYHANELTIAVGYCGVSSGSNELSWSNSSFHITGCIALNELVNCPSKFVSNNPYFVLDNLDWVQTRYLLVKMGSKKTVSVAPPTAKIPAQTACFALEGAAPKANGTSLRYLPRYPPFVVMDSNWFSTSRSLFEKLDTLAAPTESTASTAASKVILKELRTIYQLESRPNTSTGFDFKVTVGDNLYVWIVQLRGFEESLPLAQDMKKKGVEEIVLEIRFPQNYPIYPPFVRVVRPRFLQFMYGGGGHVTAGGSLCMDLLTSSGWSPSYNIESVVVCVHTALCTTDSRPARLDMKAGRGEYSWDEAVSAFERVARDHGWTVPPGIRQCGMTPGSS